jgi:hypothetical protein
MPLVVGCDCSNLWSPFMDFLSCQKPSIIYIAIWPPPNPPWLEVGQSVQALAINASLYFN